jgi:ceramide glucosyltransferase
LILIATAVVLAYQVTAILAACRQMLRRDPVAGALPAVSILKPVRGLDPGFYDAIRSHAEQDYPEFEMLFGVSDGDDPSIPDIERLAQEFPDIPVRLIRCESKALNEKVGVLEVLASEARHSVLLVNDSDIAVPTGYLRSVVAPLEDPETGIVTCLYRGAADHFSSQFEALGIATDFAPSVLVAPLVGVREFGLGSTLVFGAEQLRQIGGFRSLADYMADDYQLARRITGLGYRVHLSKTVVETGLSSRTWTDVWRHQVRWHRTIRVSKNKAYFGIVVTQATMWAALAGIAGWWQVALVTLAARMAAGLLAGIGVLGCPITLRMFWLAPIRDLFGVAVWIAGAAGRSVYWRGRRLTLASDGRILDKRQSLSNGS